MEHHGNDNFPNLQINQEHPKPYLSDFKERVLSFHEGKEITNDQTLKLAIHYIHHLENCVVSLGETGKAFTTNNGPKFSDFQKVAQKVLSSDSEEVKLPEPLDRERLRCAYDMLKKRQIATFQNARVAKPVWIKKRGRPRKELINQFYPTPQISFPQFPTNRFNPNVTQRPHSHFQNFSAPHVSHQSHHHFQSYAPQHQFPHPHFAQPSGYPQNPQFLSDNLPSTSQQHQVFPHNQPSTSQTQPQHFFHAPNYQYTNPNVGTVYNPNQPF